jgi:hypothetical protein
MARVLAIKCRALLAVGDRPAMLSAAQLAEAVPAERWVGPAPASASLVGLVRVARIRWAIGDGFQQAKGDVGLDRHDSAAGRLVSAHHPGPTGPCFAGRHLHQGHQQQRHEGGRGGLTSGLGLLPLTIPEVGRLLVPWCGQPVQPSLVLSWSRWRRRHQARATRILPAPPTATQRVS